MSAQGTDCAVEARAPATPQPAPAPLPPSRETPSRSPVPLYVAAAGAVIAIGGTVAWLVSNSRYGALKSACDVPVQCTQKVFASDSGGIKALDALSVVGWSLGGAAFVGGGLWYLASGPSAPPTSGIQLRFDPIARVASVAGGF
jgi:hypothetical protein